MVNIQMGRHLNMDALIIENEKLIVKVLPELGFKMASIVYKNIDKEFLFQPTKGRYEKPYFGDDFSKYDTSALDEMIPTIDKCEYPEGYLKGKALPDHGDVWSLPWEAEIVGKKIVGRVELKSLPLEFTKTVSYSDDNTIKMEYKVKNLSKDKIYYLWALHGLNVFDGDTEFIFDKSMKNPINVEDDEDLGSLDLKKLKSYKDGKVYKYYYDDVEKGEVGLDFKKDRIKYIIKYNIKENPYLGVWITKGGFKGEYNCALEPSNGFYDSLTLAYRNKRAHTVEAYSEDRWTIYISIEDY